MLVSYKCTQLITTPLGGFNWTEYSIVFNTQNAEEYLTIEASEGDSSNFILYIDNYVLVETTEQPNAINEQKGKKQLLKIVDILGKESSPNKNCLLFYIYTDGTVEKKLIIE